MAPFRTIAIWTGIGLAITVPLVAATFSPLLQYRQAVYIGAGFAGIAAMCLLVLQPLLARNALPGLDLVRSRRLHRLVGSIVVLLVISHIAGLWITSPPDVIDVLLLRSPTPFSIWGYLSMWALFATALVAGFRRKFALSPRLWRRMHLSLAMVIVLSTALHALLIDGTMEYWSKIALSIIVVTASGVVVWRGLYRSSK